MTHLSIGVQNSHFVEREVETPAAAGHDLLVEVEAVSVNPLDVAVAGGAGDGTVLGFDAAGTVRAVGPEVTLFRPGDRVMYAGQIDRPGSNQRYQLVDERITGPAPRTVSWAEAAALPLTSITAWESLVDHLGLDEHSEGTLLVVGATGGVGYVMLQLAEELLPKVTVVATASDEERATWVRMLGAEHTVNHREPDLAEQILEVAPEGVDWVFSAHSRGMGETYARVVKPFGHIVGVDAGLEDFQVIKIKGIAWHWESMFARPLHRTPDMVEQHRLLAHVATLVEDDLLEPVIAQELSPINAENLTRAHQIVREGRSAGKVVLSGWGS